MDFFRKYRETFLKRVITIQSLILISSKLPSLIIYLNKLNYIKIVTTRNITDIFVIEYTHNLFINLRHFIYNFYGTDTRA